MGEQPIFTTKAHVFHIDPQTKKNWIASSNGSVNVSFYYDSNRSTYRIISVDGSKAIINSTLVPNMTFTKTSQKFGQWSDARANTVYGLGFGSEMDLNKFAEKFGEVRDLTKHQLAPHNSIPKQNGDSVDSNIPSTNQAIQNSEYMTPVLDRRPGSTTSSNTMPQPAGGGGGNTMPDSNEQLKYENNRLKLALAQSSQNAKKWEVELQTLKNNNARLTTALQESTINVEEWKKQLASYKEENANLKKAVIEFEQTQPGHQEQVSNMQQELSGMMEKLSMAESDKRSAQQELESARSKFGLVAKLEDANRKQEQQIMELSREKNELEGKLNAVVDELDQAKSSQSTDKSEMVRVHDIISRNVSELMSAQSQLAKLLNS